MAYMAHPNPSAEGRWDNEIWGSIHLELSDGALIEDLTWDLGAFISWFLDSAPSIVDERLTIGSGPHPGESLSQALDRMDEELGDLLDVDQSEAERRYEALRRYREHHQLNAGLRGSVGRPWIVGLNVGGEISLTGDVDRAERIDLPQFVDSVREASVKFLEDSLARRLASDGDRVARSLLERLRYQPN